MSSTSTLKESCISILKSIYSHDIGFPVLPSATSTQSLDSQLTSNEVQLLSLYDKLSSLTVERKTLEAEIAALENNDQDTIIVTDDPREAQDAVSEAIARNLVKDCIVNTTIITRPILHAIHGGKDSTNQERNLLPLLKDRDRLSSLVLHLTAQLTLLLDQKSSIGSQNIRIQKSNRTLTSRLMQLTARSKLDIGRSDEYLETQAKLKSEKRKLEMVKGVVQGVIVGSGVDWAADDQLRELVLACGEDEDG